VTIDLDLSTAVDVGAERARLTKELAGAEQELEQTGKKLANQGFLANAKPEVVDGIRARNAAASADIERITAALAALPAS
jgi:valyl-tRNA synthetase